MKHRPKTYLYKIVSLKRVTIRSLIIKTVEILECLYIVFYNPNLGCSQLLINCSSGCKEYGPLSWWCYVIVFNIDYILKGITIKNDLKQIQMNNSNLYKIIPKTVQITRKRMGFLIFKNIQHNIFNQRYSLHLLNNTLIALHRIMLFIDSAKFLCKLIII